MQLPTYQKKHQYRDSIMAENIIWIVDFFVPNHKYIIWAADIHISKNAKWENMGVEWEKNQSMIECLANKIDKNIFSIGVKPKKSISRNLRKKMKIKSKLYYLNLTKLPLNMESKFKTEHEAIIICGKTKGIRKYKM